MEETTLEYQSVRMVDITEAHAGQRLDNFLIRELSGLPRSRVYRIIRKGEVRVNKKRAKPTQKLHINDVVRIPPLQLAPKTDQPQASVGLLRRLQEAILLEDEHIILINKPAGLVVHGGSGFDLGLIEAFRQLRPNVDNIELAHRLDKETSGLLILTKTRPALQAIHHLFASGGLDKRYLTLVQGCWRGNERQINTQLQKTEGKRAKMQVAEGGKESRSIFSARQVFADKSLLEVKLLTGRMHQIRTQLEHIGMPVLGDDRYGDFALNRTFKKMTGLKRLFLHAYHLDFTLEFIDRRYQLDIPLADDLQKVVDQL